MLATALAAQSEIMTIRGAEDSRMGFAVAGLGDTNGDGVPDFGTGAPFEDPEHQTGVARVHSGIDGSVLRGVYGGQGGAWSGYAVAGPGDVNGDAANDFLVGIPGEYGGGEVVCCGVAPTSWSREIWVEPTWGGVGSYLSAAGDIDRDGKQDILIQGSYQRNYTAWIISAAELLKNTGKPPPFAGFATALYVSMAAVGDVDGDGWPDVAAATSPQEPQEGAVTVLSGRLLAPIATFTGNRVAAAGDVDHDGHADVLVARLGWAVSGEVRVYSGADQSVLRTLTVPMPTPCYGDAIAGDGDLDGDGIADLLVGDPAGPGPGRVWAFSGATGAVLYELAGERPGDRFGFSVGFLGDLDGDRRDDLAIGAPGDPYYWTRLWSDGYVRVVSGAPRATYANTESLVATTGGSQTLHFSAGADLGTLPYLVVGTLSGMSPGVPLQGWHIPLNPDAYTALLLSGSMPSSAFSGLSGRLSDAGMARATLKLPAGLAGALLGTTFHHLFLVFDAQTLFRVGAPVRLAIVP